MARIIYRLESFIFSDNIFSDISSGTDRRTDLACMYFGWLPCLLWIALGVVLIGAVHVFLSLASSVRHDAKKSIAESARENLEPAKYACLG